MADDSPRDAEPSIDQLWSYVQGIIVICMSVAGYGRGQHTVTAISLCGGFILMAVESARRADRAARAKRVGDPSAQEADDPGPRASIVHR